MVETHTMEDMIWDMVEEEGLVMAHHNTGGILTSTLCSLIRASPFKQGEKQIQDLFSISC